MIHLINGITSDLKNGLEPKNKYISGFQLSMGKDIFKNLICASRRLLTASRMNGHNGDTSG